jgi:hypothetical protein
LLLGRTMYVRDVTSLIVIYEASHMLILLTTNGSIASDQIRSDRLISRQAGLGAVVTTIELLDR